jgi:alpha-L-fucosidase 2
VAATAQVGPGIFGCNSRELRFAADQGGGQRLTGEVDRMAIFPAALSPADVGRRMAIFPAALSPADVGRWQALAFG